MEIAFSHAPNQVPALQEGTLYLFTLPALVVRRSCVGVCALGRYGCAALSLEFLRTARVLAALAAQQAPGTAQQALGGLLRAVDQHCWGSIARCVLGHVPYVWCANAWVGNLTAQHNSNPARAGAAGACSPAAALFWLHLHLPG